MEVTGPHCVDRGTPLRLPVIAEELCFRASCCLILKFAIMFFYSIDSDLTPTVRIQLVRARKKGVYLP